jgi:hypothetical protein
MRDLIQPGYIIMSLFHLGNEPIPLGYAEVCIVYLKKHPWWDVPEGHT